MKYISHFFQLARINYILMRYNIDEIILGDHWFLPLRALVYINPFYWTKNRHLPRAVRIRLAIERLGPIYVKAGQIFSTRRDLLPDDIATELTKLQDRVKPFPGDKAKQIIESSLNAPISELFQDFDIQALASASIAQVHAATLLNGDKVVIKVLRPKIDVLIERDIELLQTMARLSERYWRRTRHMKPRELVNEVAQTLNDELDLMREGANASQLRRHFENSEELYIPKVYWDYSRTNILTLERIYGIPIHSVERIHNVGIDTVKLSRQIIEVFFTQVFRDSFFHADLHPGNIFVSDQNTENPMLIAVDFGIVGSLNHSDQRYIAENMIAFFKRDYQKVAELHIACGWLPPDTRIDQFEGAIRAVSEPIFEQPLRDISFGKLLLRLFQVARQFNINIQPQLILLQKSLLNIEGLCRSLAPDFNLWESAAPQIEKWLKKQVGVKSFIRRVRDNLPLWSEQLPELPNMIYEVLRETKQQQERLRFQLATQNDLEKDNGNAKIKYFVLGTVLTSIVIALTIYL